MSPSPSLTDWPTDSYSHSLTLPSVYRVIVNYATYLMVHRTSRSTCFWFQVLRLRVRLCARGRQHEEGNMEAWPNWWDCRGIYSGQPEKFFPPLKFFPVFVDFLRSFKLHKGILTCVLSLLSFFFSSPPFPFLFHEVLLQILLFFNLDKNSPPPPRGGKMARIYIPA